MRIPNPSDPQVLDKFMSAFGREVMVLFVGEGKVFYRRSDGQEAADTKTWVRDNWKPVIPSIPDRWGVMYGNGEVVTWSELATAKHAVASERDTVLVHYVGTVVEE